MIGSTNTLLYKKGGFINPKKTTKFVWDKMDITLPFNFVNGTAVTTNNYEIQLLGGQSSGSSHYRWDGSVWKSMTTLPYSFRVGDAVIYDNGLLLLGGTSNGNVVHNYQINDTSTSSKSWYRYSDDIPLPVAFINGSAVVWDNKAHLLGGTNPYMHYSIDDDDGVLAVWASTSTLPYPFTGGYAVVYNNEIHILGSSVIEHSKKHYKFDRNTSTWVSVSTLPYEFYEGDAVVYEGKIHIMGTGYVGSNQKSHYVWDGTKWESLSTLPYEFCYGAAVNCDYKLYLLGGGNDSSHYKDFYCGQEKDIYQMTLPRNAKVMAFEPKIESGDITMNDYGFTVNGEDYVDITFSVPTGTPITIVNNNSILYSVNGIIKEKLKVNDVYVNYQQGRCVMFNDELHSFTGWGHYKYNFKTRVWSTEVRHIDTNGSIILYNNELHFLGTGDDSLGHYKWDGNTFTQVSTMPYRFNGGSALIIDGQIHIFGTAYKSGSTLLTYNHYRWDGTTWIQEKNLPLQCHNSGVAFYNGEIHVFGGTYSSRLHYKWNGTAWVRLPDLPYALSADVLTVVYKGQIHAFSGSGYSSVVWHGVWDGTKWIQMEPIPTSLYIVTNAFIYDDKIYVVGGYGREIFYAYDGNTWDNRVMKPGCAAFKNMRINGEVVDTNKAVLIDENPLLLQY